MQNTNLLKTFEGIDLNFNLSKNNLSTSGINTSINNTLNSFSNNINSISSKMGQNLGRLQRKDGVVGFLGKSGNVFNDSLNGVAQFATSALSKAWGSSKSVSWDNSANIANKKNQEAQQYQTTNVSVADIKKSLGVSQIGDSLKWLENKGNESNTITGTTETKTSSNFRTRTKTTWTNTYWLESTDSLLNRYGYQTYAQKAVDLKDSMDWLSLKTDINNLKDNTFISKVNDTAGQELEREVAKSQMNNYFGNYGK